MVQNADYWTVNFDMIENVKKAFDENGITIPFNQLDVHVISDATTKAMTPSHNRAFCTVICTQACVKMSLRTVKFAHSTNEIAYKRAVAEDYKSKRAVSVRVCFLYKFEDFTS